MESKEVNPKTDKNEPSRVEDLIKDEDPTKQQSTGDINDSSRVLLHTKNKDPERIKERKKGKDPKTAKSRQNKNDSSLAAP